MHYTSNFAKSLCARCSALEKRYSKIFKMRFDYAISFPGAWIPEGKSFTILVDASALYYYTPSGLCLVFNRLE